jgi:uncharacterized protein YhaN
MTLLGKIFTVLIFIMSVLFFAFSLMVFATHKNWKIMADNPNYATNPKNPNPGLKQQVEQHVARYKAAQAQLADLKRQLEQERAARRQALSVLQSALTQKSAQLVEREAEYIKLQAANGVALQDLKDTQKTLADLTDEVNKLRADVVTAQQDRDGQFDQVVKLTDDLHQLEAVKTRLEERRDQLAIDVSRYKKQLDIRGIKVDDPIDNIAPKMKGEVTAVSSKDLVEISLGSDDGLRVNHQLDVFRNASYLGKITVVKTSPDRAVAQIVKESQRGPIMKGDKVGTKLISVGDSN